MDGLKPITAKERIVVLDIIRGFAILGIFFVNMQDFSFPWLYYETGMVWKKPLDIGAEIMIDIFAQASFYTLFSFLFGFGTVIFMERAIAKGYSFSTLYLRRLFSLLGIGVVHAFLIWHGDILITYAITGFLLLFFIKMEGRFLLWWAVALIMLPSIYFGGLTFLAESRATQPLSRFNSYYFNKSLEVYQTGNFQEITAQRFFDWTNVNWGDGLFFIIITLLPMFLLGVYFAKKRFFHHVMDHQGVLKSLWTITLVISILFKIVLPYTFHKSFTLFYLQDAIGGPASALFYAISIVLLSQKEYWLKKLSFFSYIGRLSLSNYLFQSILGTFIFYGYGLGFYGRVSPFYGMLLAIAIYTLQIYLSKKWLEKFLIGPVEWIWRTFTYKKAQKLKRIGLENEG